MIGWSKSMATELAARGITVNCIAPGFIESAMTQELDEAQRQQILNQIPSGEMGAPDDIAAAAVYLASEQAKYVNGHTLHVNGGMAML
jgi:3-oxoacyl-[acyl-carrier protein] reductase